MEVPRAARSGEGEAAMPRRREDGYHRSYMRRREGPDHRSSRAVPDGIRGEGAGVDGWPGVDDRHHRLAGLAGAQSRRDEPDAAGASGRRRRSSAWESARRRWWSANGRVTSCGAWCRSTPGSSAQLLAVPVDLELLEARLRLARDAASRLIRPAKSSAVVHRGAAVHVLRPRDHPIVEMAREHAILTSRDPARLNTFLDFPRQSMSS